LGPPGGESPLGGVVPLEGTPPGGEGWCPWGASPLGGGVLSSSVLLQRISAVAFYAWSPSAPGRHWCHEDRCPPGRSIPLPKGWKPLRECRVLSSHTPTQGAAQTGMRYHPVQRKTRARHIQRSAFFVLFLHSCSVIPAVSERNEGGIVQHWKDRVAWQDLVWLSPLPYACKVRLMP
jgi:hypothetical protein